MTVSAMMVNKERALCFRGMYDNGEEHGFYTFFCNTILFHILITLCLDLYGLFTTHYKFITFNTIVLIPPQSPGTTIFLYFTGVTFLDSTYK